MSNSDSPFFKGDSKYPRPILLICAVVLFGLLSKAIRGAKPRDTLDVSPSFVIVLMQHYQKTGQIEGRPRGGARRDSLSRYLKTLTSWIEADPNLTLAQMSERLLADHGASSTESGLSKLLRRSGFTYKVLG